jgi:homoserine kinase type II
VAFSPEKASKILECWDIAFLRFRSDLEITGSPERTLDRTVVEDDRKRLFRLEKVGFLNVERKNEIARTQALLARTLPEVISPLPLPDGTFVAEFDGAFWQATPYVEGLPLPRPDYAGEGWRGPVLGDFLVRLKAAERTLPAADGAAVFSAGRFIEDLDRKIEGRHPALMARLRPAVRSLEERLFPEEAGLPTGFAHGDFHPLNMVWSETGVRTVVDWEFCGWKSEMYDAALLVGCLGMEHPRFLDGDLVHSLLDRLRKDASFAASSWKAFSDLVLALRFAWLSDWLRRGDAEMIDLETVFIGLLLENRDFFIRAWRLPP